MPETKTYTAKHLFTGERWLQDHSVIVQNGKISEIVPAASAPVHDTIIPAFIDLQLYGAYGKLFSVYPEPQTLSLIHQYCRQGGAWWFQPTVATNTIDIFHRCVDGVKAYWKNGGEGCLGLHVEGPWISKEKKGAHIESLVRTPSIAEVKALLEYGKGVISMITLAPEVCSDEVIDTIQQYDVIISAGHSNATYQQANDGFAKGINVVTHLYNAMSGLRHREPGLVGATLLDRNVYASIIADGHHVDYAAIKIAKTIMKDRLFLITDAVTETTTGAYPHQLAGDKYVASGILSGSALTMMQAVKNMIAHAGTDKTEAIQMACSIPGKLVKDGSIKGIISPGSEAHFIITDGSLDVIDLV